MGIDTAIYQTNNTPYLHPHWEKFENIPESYGTMLGFFMTFITLLATTGNGLVLWCYGRSKSLRNTSNMFIVNLAVADLLMSTIDFPMFIAASFLHDWPFGRFGCKIYGFLTGLAGLVTINSLAVIAVDRYNAVARRINNVFSVSRAKVIISISSTWIFAMIFAAGPMIGWSDYILESIKSTCSFDFLTRDTSTRSFILSIICFEFVLPMSIILWAYLQILREMVKRRKAFTELSADGHSLRIVAKRSRIKSEIRTSVIILGLVMLFSIAWTPYTIVAIIGQFGDRSLISPYVTIISSVIAKTSTVSNPIVYAIVHPKFKVKIMYLLKYHLCKKKATDQFSVFLSDDSVSKL